MFRGGWKIRWTRRLSAGKSPVGRFLGRLLASVFFGLFLGLGILFVGLVAREAWRAAETFGWAERRCEILHSAVVRAGGEEPYLPRVDYRTLDAGERISGSGIQRRELSYGSYRDAAARLAAYPLGARVPCYASPVGEVVLERGPLWIGLWTLLPLVFVAIGGVGLVAIWRRGKQDRFGRPMPKPLGEGASRWRAGRVLMAFGLVLAITGGVIFWFVGVLPLARMRDAQGWQRHDCTVEHSSVIAHHDDDGTTYSVDILYRWDRGRGIERSSRYSFFGGSSSGRAGKAEIVQAHPVGAEVPCWVHPKRTNEAVLERGLTSNALVAAVPLVFLAAGCGMLVAGRRKATRRARMRSRTHSGESPFSPDDPLLDVLPDFELRPGPLRLASRSSRWGRVLGISFAALFWNGIVSVFAYQAWKAWERGRPDWFLVLFLVPFVLVGIGLVLAILHSLLALRNPRPTLFVSSRTPLLGEELGLQWSFAGRRDRLERLRIALVGREQATYQVGTDTRTATEDFFEHVVVDAPAPTCFALAQARFAIPDGSMHSFQSAHNKILWMLELEGKIRRWPDVRETYPLVVLPRPAGGASPEGR